jgi:hypothetical protein
MEGFGLLSLAETSRESWHVQTSESHDFPMNGNTRGMDIPHMLSIRPLLSSNSRDPAALQVSDEQREQSRAEQTTVRVVAAFAELQRLTAE